MKSLSIEKMSLKLKSLLPYRPSEPAVAGEASRDAYRARTKQPAKQPAKTQLLDAYGA
jgi:hypothetical protein